MKPRLFALALSVTAAIAAFASCNRSRPTELQVGIHRMTGLVPGGWERLDYGQRLLFQRELARFMLADLGPAEPVAYAREIEAVQELWLSGQDAGALDRLSKLRLLRASFATRDEYEAAGEAAQDLQKALREGTYLQTKDSFRSLIDALAQLPTPEVDGFADYVLGVSDHDERRDIASTAHRDIGGRDALVIETWDRLTHGSRKRLVLLLNEGSLLLAATELGPFEETGSALAALVESIAFR